MLGMQFEFQIIFWGSNNNVDYPIELIDLEEFLENRINYFFVLAKNNGKNIISNINSECQVKISKIELERLIDNNLSNAIKYSFENSDIYVTLDKNQLTFKTKSLVIKDKKKIFTKYYRENDIIGGYGLGLYIVKQICQKYQIKIKLDSNTNFTTFKYIFKCFEEEDEDIITWRW